MTKLSVVTSFAVKVVLILINKLLSLLTKISYFFNDQLSTAQSTFTPGVSSSIGRQSNEIISKSILVTTFELRFFENCLPLIKQLRAIDIRYPITVFVNGNLDHMHDATLRSNFLQEISQISDVSVVCCNYMAGTSRIWNLGIQMLDSDLVLCLSDDVEVSPNFSSELDYAFSQGAKEGLTILNQFCSFIISRRCIELIGWFDERYLGFGEEDGDYIWRYEEKFGKPPLVLRAPGVRHLNSQVRDSYVEGKQKWSLINAIFGQIKYVYNPLGISGRFEEPRTSTLSSMDFYPLETFRRSTYDLLKESSNSKIQERLRVALGNFPTKHLDHES